MNNDNPAKNGFYVCSQRVGFLVENVVLVFKDGEWYSLKLKKINLDGCYLWEADTHDFELLAHNTTLHKYFAAKRFLGLEVI